MSYRTIKRLLGETSLERKCRFLFGSGLLLLITGSFAFYAWQTRKLVFEQNRVRAQAFVASVILRQHAAFWESQPDEDGPPEERPIEKMAAELKELETNYNWRIMKLDLSDSLKRPADLRGYQAIERIRLDPKRIVTEEVRDETRWVFNCYTGVFATESCIQCHHHRMRNDRELAEVGDLIGVCQISFPLDKTYRDLAWNNALLLATAIVTAFLAVLSAYAIVRYVIVKPVLHLKDVSDAIARGSLDQRADIRTGDEFEELSHAFNRMLRHMMTAQEDLLVLNRGYEAKVDELAQANLKLFEMNNLKNEFLATMSHELRTPLNSILGFSDVLISAQNLNDKQKRFMGHIQSAGKNLLTLITDVLDLAKIESGKMKLRPVDFSLIDLIERQVASLLPLAEKKNLDLGWEVDPRLPPLFQDPGKIQQILGNLLSNAIKFTPEGGMVRVLAEYRAGEVLPSGEVRPDQFAMIVQDTGIGIPLEEQDKIFEKFRQGRSAPGQRDALTREYEGTGLGLSIVRELARLLGGEIRLQSEFGRGSVFTVTLPIRLGRSETEVLDENEQAWHGLSVMSVPQRYPHAPRHAAEPTAAITEADRLSSREP